MSAAPRARGGGTELVLTEHVDQRQLEILKRIEAEEREQLRLFTVEIGS